MTSQEAVSIARRHKDPNDAARHIADISRKRWLAETDNTLTDDITAVVMRLDHKDSRGRGKYSDCSTATRATSEKSSAYSSTCRSKGAAGASPMGHLDGSGSRMHSLLSTGHPCSMVSMPTRRE